MDKDIITQYADLREEVKELHMKIGRLERQINAIEKGGTVKDSVKGGLGGIEHFIVEGTPIPEYNKKVRMLKKMKSKLEIREMDLLETLNEVEDFINSVPDSHMRRIINLKVVEDLTWQQVATRMGGGNAEDGVKKAFQRYMKKHSDKK